MVARRTTRCYSCLVKSPKKNVGLQKLRPATSSIRWREEDWELIEKLQKKIGVSSVTDLSRMGLRALAEKEKLQ